MKTLLFFVVTAYIIIKIINLPIFVKRRAIKSWEEGFEKDNFEDAFPIDNYKTVDKKMAQRIYNDLIIKYGISFGNYSSNLIYIVTGASHPHTTNARGYNSPLDRPPGAPLWSLAAFPDVWKWIPHVMTVEESGANKKLTKKIETIGDDYIQRQGSDSKFDIKTIDQLIELYLENSKHGLECRAGLIWY